VGASVTKDESVAAADNSARAAQLEILSAAVCKLLMLFECRDCGSELMLENRQRARPIPERGRLSFAHQDEGQLAPDHVDFG
jgi:hypothetical protein